MGITKSPTGQVCLPLCENLTHGALEPPLLPVRYFPPFHHPVCDLVSCLFSGQVSISFSKSQGWKAVVLTNPLNGSLPSQQVQHCALCLTLDWHFLHTVDSEGHFSSQAGLFHICGQATAWVFMRLLHLNQSWPWSYTYHSSILFPRLGSRLQYAKGCCGFSVPASSLADFTCTGFALKFQHT